MSEASAKTVKPYTVGQLIGNLGLSEDNRQKGERLLLEAETIERSLAGLGEEAVYEAEVNAENARDKARVLHESVANFIGFDCVRSDVRRLQTLCEAESGRFDAETMRQLRGKLCESKGLSIEVVSAMTLDDFADAMTRKGTSGEEAVLRLATIFTNGVADSRIKQAATIVDDDKLSANDKLMRIDKLTPFPATASSADLGKLFGVTKQAIQRTDWWIKNRKGERANEVGRRRGKHLERAEQSKPDIRDDDFDG